MAGDGRGYHRICGINKAFLPLDGYPLFIHVLRALDAVREIDRVYVVGPKRQIAEAIEVAASTLAFTKKVIVLDQKRTLLENALFSYAQALADSTPSPAGQPADPPALFLPADIPFVTAGEIETFISRADMARYDYCLGVVPETALRPFYPHAGKQGIKMSYLYLKDKIYRVNNLHLVRPYRVGMLSYIQKTYDLRYQSHLGNRLRTIYEIVKAPKCISGLLLYLLAQGATWFSGVGLTKAALFCSHFLPMSRVENEASHFLRARFKVVEVDLCGSALDVDDEATYRTMSVLFKEWRSFTLSGSARCPAQ